MTVGQQTWTPERIPAGSSGGRVGGGTIPVLVIERSSQKTEPRAPLIPTCAARNLIWVVPNGATPVTEQLIHVSTAVFVKRCGPSTGSPREPPPAFKNWICSTPKFWLESTPPVLCRGSPDQFNPYPLKTQI